MLEEGGQTWSAIVCLSRSPQPRRSWSVAGSGESISHSDLSGKNIRLAYDPGSAFWRFRRMLRSERTDHQLWPTGAG
jgi:hypothetical protein